jgi:hypothetical protein
LRRWSCADGEHSPRLWPLFIFVWQMWSCEDEAEAEYAGRGGKNIYKFRRWKFAANFRVKNGCVTSDGFFQNTRGWRMEKMMTFLGQTKYMYMMIVWDVFLKLLEFL